MRPVSARAVWSALLLILLTLPGVTTAHAQHRTGNATIEENGIPAPAAAGRITGTITGIDDIESTKPYMLVYPADDTTNDGVAVYGEINANGTYSVSDLGPGRYLLVTSADGYMSQYYNQVTEAIDATPVRVTANSTVTGIDFPMKRRWPGTGIISGTVRNEMTGRGIAGAQVMISRNDGTYEMAQVVTRSNGTYRISGLAAGSYILEVWAENHAGEFYGGGFDRATSTPVVVTAATETSAIDFSLTQGGELTGRVVDGEGNPISGAMVEAIQISGDDSTYVWATDRMSYTDDNGNYTLGGLANGRYQVMAMTETKWSMLIEWYNNVSTPDSATPVSVSINNTTASINFSLESQPTTGVITGTVVDASGERVPGAIISIESIDEDNPFGFGIWTSAETNSLGVYSFTDLPDGAYYVSVSAQLGPQYVAEWFPNAVSIDEATPVVVTAGLSDPVAVDFALDFEIGRSAIGGTVRFADGNAAVGVGVELIAIDPATGSDIYSLYAYTDQDGKYGFPVMPAGSYLLRASHWADGSYDEKWYRGASTRNTAMTITLGAEDIRTGVDFELSLESSVGTLSGRVTDDSTGAPVERAYIEVVPLEYGYYSGELAFNAITDDEGRYTLGGIPAGAYAVTVYSNGGIETFENAASPWEGTPVAIVKDSTTTVNFGVGARNDGPGVISGRVAGDRGEDIDLAVVVAIEVDGENLYPAITGANGSYEIGGLPAGKYVVYSFAPRYIGEYYSDAFDPYDANLVTVAATGASTGIDFSLFADAARNLPEDSGGSGAPQTTGTVTGVVRSSDGTPIAGATVYILDDNGSPVSSARTGTDGQYEIGNVPGGAGYRLRATGIGYESRYNDNSTTFDDASRIVVLQGRRTVDFTLQRRTSGIGTGVGRSTPTGISLSSAQPNPFTSRTEITFTLPGESAVRVEVRDLLGGHVAGIFNGRLGGGRQSIIWDARDDRGNLVPAGVYLYRVSDGRSISSGQVILIR